MSGIIQLGNRVNSKDDILVLNDYWFNNIHTLKSVLPKCIISPYEYAFSHIPAFIQMLGIPFIFLNIGEIKQLKAGEYVSIDFNNNSVGSNSHYDSFYNDKMLFENGVCFYSSIKGQKIDSYLISQSSGVGLVSTEFLFYKSKNISKRHQFNVLSNLCKQNPTLDYTIRLFDICVDKIPVWAQQKYSNHKCNIGRGVNLGSTDSEKNLFNQLSVIKELSKKYKISVLVPYLTDIDEIMKIKMFLQQNFCNNVRLGAMIESVDILPIIKELNKIVDFYSLGTNDIVQSFFKIDRTKPICFNKVDLKNKEFRFLLLEILTLVQNKSIRVCGQLPVMPGMLSAMIEIGYKQFTVNPYWIKYLKAVAFKCII